jgi:hypothetical protein
MQLDNPQTVAAMVVPIDGPKVIPVVLDFSGATSIPIDAYSVIEQKKIGYLQTVQIDNSLNDQSITLTCDLTNQRIICPPRAQGNFNIFMPNLPQFVAETTGAVIVRMYFTNVPLMPAIWSTQSVGGGGNVTVDGGTLDAVTAITDPVAISSIADPVTVVEAPLAYTEVPLALDGTNQQIFAAGNVNISAFISNPTGNNPVTVNPAGGDATVSGVVIQGGGFIELTSVSNAVTVSGTNTESIVGYYKS